MYWLKASKSLCHQDFVAARDFTGHPALQLYNAILVDELQPVFITLPRTMWAKAVPQDRLGFEIWFS